MKKRILFVYPHNFFTEKSGINSRCIELLRYFRAVDIKVDLLTLDNFKSSWENYPADREGLLDEIFFYDFKKGSRLQLPKNRKQNPLAWLKKHIPFLAAYTTLPDFAYKSMKKRFAGIIKLKQYDFIIISYVYWAGLIQSKTIEGITTVLDLSDFITLNRFDHGDKVKIGTMIEEEIRRVNLFDKVMCISEDEKNFFSQFAPHPQYRYIPFFMDKNTRPGTDSPDHDILFIGSDNPHNRKGIAWFFKEIHPYLFRSVRILIVGSISKYINETHNVTCLPVADKIAGVYNRARISICPLLGGTGMKIKVVEALSFGLPVVTTTKGLAGFPSKLKTGCIVADSPDEFARAIQRLLTDMNLYNQQQKWAEDFFLENFERTTVYRQLDELFADDITRTDTQVLNIKDPQ